MATQQPWWTFPRIDNFGTMDPQGYYWKPDSNIQLPGGYPITALLPGTVTDVTHTNWGQTVVNIRLDTPLNSLATHTFYEHMASATVQPGQRVSAGQLIGYNNPAGQVPLGFGLFSGDQYASGSAWMALQHDLCPGCPGKLNPTKLLDAAKAGNTTSITTLQSCGPLDIGCQVSNLTAQLKVYGEYIAIFVIALLLLVMGLYLVAQRQVEEVGSRVIGSGAKAAEVAA